MSFYSPQSVWSRLNSERQIHFYINYIHRLFPNTSAHAELSIICIFLSNLIKEINKPTISKGQYKTNINNIKWRYGDIFAGNLWWAEIFFSCKVQSLCGGSIHGLDVIRNTQPFKQYVYKLKSHEQLPVVAPNILGFIGVMLSLVHRLSVLGPFNTAGIQHVFIYSFVYIFLTKRVMIS